MNDLKGNITGKLKMDIIRKQLEHKGENQTIK